MNSWSLLACAALVGCTPPGSGAPVPASVASAAASSAPTDQLVSFEGIVRASASRAGPGKKFVGALFEQDGGTSWVIDYSSDSPFRELADRRVAVTGRRYEPEDQALMMPHLRVESMKLVKLESGPELVEIHAEEKLAGHFEKFTWEKGTKLEGETWVRFVADAGKSYFIAHGASSPPIGMPVTVTAYPVEPSPFVARPGGPWLWIVKVDPN